MLPRDAIFQHAKELELSSIGICPPDQLGEAKAHFESFLDSGQYGDMTWMKEKADRRGDPQVLWPEVKSIIMIGLNYGPEENPLKTKPKPDQGDISVYARGKDYHELFKKRIKRLARFIHAEYSADVKVFVDTAPVMEKPLAQLAGLGWQGKHTNMVSNEFGSWLFLGAIYTTLELETDLKHKDQCGQCTACIDICPTKAITAPYKLDASSCISYLTIEHKGHIDEHYRTAMANHIYGCDDCLSVCPWNKFAKLTNEQAFYAREHLKNPSLETLLQFDDAAFREFFKGTPIKRTGRDRFTRNVLIATHNSGNTTLLPLVEKLLNDQSPLVRAMAVWAYVGLATESAIAKQKAKFLPKEQDDNVIDEWNKA